MNAISKQVWSDDCYRDSSKLLQRRDQDWVLDQAQIKPDSLLDLGCGVGSLLVGASQRWPALQALWGIDRNALRLTQAREQLDKLTVDIHLLESDLRDLPPLQRRFDVVTMTAVLHWLYPDEQRLFRWVAQHLAPHGVFLLTSHHPVTRQGLGGEDDLVVQALLEMGVTTTDQIATLYAAAELEPMGTRTRAPQALGQLIQQHFHIDAVTSRPAALHVRDELEYERFHQATFGTYFATLVSPQRREEFFTRLGQIAMQRMRSDGRVTEIPVNVWRCLPRGIVA